MKNTLLKYSLSSAFFDMAQNLIKSFGIVFFYIRSDYNLYVAIGAIVLNTSIELIFLYISSHFIGRIGTKASLIISRILFFLSSIPLLYLDNTNYPIIIIIWAILFGSAKAIYFVPLHFMLLQITKDVKRGSSIGILFAFSSILGIFSPILAGILSSNYSNQGFALLLLLLFIISIFFIKDVPNYKFNYTGRIRDSLDLKNIKREIKYSLMFQIQSQDGFWNINVFNILKYSFLELGFINTVINIIGALLNILLGNWLDKHNRMQTLRINAFLQGSGWMMRSLVNSPLGVVVSDSYMKLTTQALGENLTVVTYDLISSKGNEILLDEKIIAREMILVSTYILVGLLSILSAYLFGIGSVFVIAVIACLGMVLI